ncbi:MULTISPECIES: preprotein translocase subunit SecY [Candidatus Ichthyocystis]|uniref:Protein translocase subunit SecY n=1 Tax=Candidatus Ichthyocystis hellenicum TaxID=1561003 RepID=A0A0S4M3R1_9BURK|nr:MULTISPECIES: preprotein translocase subunit SecY [Ichthyocystis]CUT17370.1 preprotein translocase subunit SecY [Candidatus Ichthyocystis hellenicum]
MDGVRRYADLRGRILFLLGALIVYRIGAHVPVPGIDVARLSHLFKSQSHGLLAMFNVFSGGALQRFTVFALGIVPYISASIIVQLLSVAVPHLDALRKEGEVGRRKITQYTRFATVGLGFFQGVGIAVALDANNLSLRPGLSFVLMTALTLVSGTMFLMWLGEQITERGLGNGVSIIIFAGIASGLPNSLSKLLTMVRLGQISPLFALFICFLVFFVTAVVVFVERGQRRIPVQYAKRQSSGQVYSAQSSHLPLKVNMSGVVPPLFASSVILFPTTLISWFSSSRHIYWLRDLASSLSPGQPLHFVVYGVAVVFFCFFYTALVFDPKETADNLKRGGAFVPGIRPGEHTAQYFEKVILRLTLVGSVYITLVCLLPEFLNIKWGIPFYFGGTSLLIVVVVTMDFIAQLQAYLMTHHYESLLKKSNFKGGAYMR